MNTIQKVSTVTELDFLEKQETRNVRKLVERSNLFEELDDYEFQRRFRLTKESVAESTLLIEDKLESKTPCNNALNPVEQVLIAVRFYAVACMQLAIADLFDVSQPTVRRVVHRFSEALASLLPDFIHLPVNRDECKTVAARRLDESNLLESSKNTFKVAGSITFHHLTCYLATLDLNTLSNLNIPFIFLELIGNINANLYSPKRRLRRLVERFRTDSSQVGHSNCQNFFIHVSRKFFSIAGFPKVIGDLDGTFVRIVSLGREDAERFRCQKNYFALNVQTIVDSDLVIRNVVAKWPGFAHDSTVFNSCVSCLSLKTNELYKDFLLQGDTGYACEKYLLTPFGNPRSLSEVRYLKGILVN
ncbi:nuclease HARBI1 [Trichonephila clavipes]|nr:nuclease HARBI1 [Trichonephila clavipes]